MNGPRSFGWALACSTRGAAGGSGLPVTVLAWGFGGDPDPGERALTSVRHKLEASAERLDTQGDRCQADVALIERLPGAGRVHPAAIIDDLKKDPVLYAP